MSPLTFLRGVLSCGLSLTLTTNAFAQSAETMPVPGAEQLDGPSGFIRNNGHVVLLAKDDAARLHLLVWTKSSLRRVELPGALDFQWQAMVPLTDDRFILLSTPDDGSMHGGPRSTQLYSLAGSGKAKLRWTGSEADYDYRPIQVSGDGKAWGVMAPSFASNEARLHFAFGNFRSSRVRRTHTVVFHDWTAVQAGFQEEESMFTFLASDGPVLMTADADDVHLLRFTDSGVISEQIKPLTPLMFFEWQDEDRVLWSGGHNEWLAWNLWDLGLSGFPEEPFLRFPANAGRPHRTRGFVRTVRDGNSYRVEHLWQSPQIPSWRERHVSEWQTGTPVGVSEWQQEMPAWSWEVSPNGRHVLVFEQRLTKGPENDPNGLHALEEAQSPRKSPEMRFRYYAKRFELSPAPVEFPEPIEPKR